MEINGQMLDAKKALAYDICISLERLKNEGYSKVEIDDVLELVQACVDRFQESKNT